MTLTRYSLENAQRALNNTQLRAPISGTVLAVNAEAGETVGTAPIITVADLSASQLRFWVEESDLMSVAGQPCTDRLRCAARPGLRGQGLARGSVARHGGGHVRGAGLGQH
ncbi:MAG: HlyD family efflux transporter periplasmic adaptor subunit [Anaerolineae bacterium]|nr:HlyD family efflux transporter periplasmic adaptor subunit [Anaerolineae bacterium]